MRSSASYPSGSHFIFDCNAGTEVEGKWYTSQYGWVICVDWIESNCSLHGICLLEKFWNDLAFCTSTVFIICWTLGFYSIPSKYKSPPSVGRLTLREPVYTEISNGLYVGGWPSSVNILPPGEPSVLDCTCELPRMSFISRNNYLCIATWDTRAPRPADIESAVRWVCRKRAQKKPVYIHCAYGHGRSVCVICAVLVAVGIADDWKNAEKIIREKRPCIQMNGLQRKSLEEWSKYRLSSKRNGEANVASGLQSDS